MRILDEREDIYQDEQQRLLIDMNDQLKFDHMRVEDQQHLLNQ